MKVLFVCHRVPFPPKRGGKIRPFNIIRHLHEQGHEVTVASLARSQAEVDEAEGLARHCSQRLVEVVDDRLAWWAATTPDADANSRTDSNACTDCNANPGSDTDPNPVRFDCGGRCGGRQGRLQR